MFRAVSSRWTQTAVAAMGLLALLSLGGVAAVSAQTSSSTASASASSYTVGVATSATLGTYLVNGTGFALYYFAADTVGVPPTSACTTACLSVWPAFYASSIVVELGSGLDASAFTTFTNQAGQTQDAYMGHPLYYYVADIKAGDTTGQGLDINGGYWYVTPLSFTTSTSTTSSVSTDTTTTTSTTSTSSSTIALSPAIVVSLAVAASTVLATLLLGSRLRGGRRGTMVSRFFTPQNGPI